MQRKIVAFVGLVVLLVGAVTILWLEEWRYQLPTPIPTDHRGVEVGANIAHPQISDEALLLHFYNPSCPCSRFNLAHLTTLHNKYKQRIKFVIVVPESVTQTSEEISTDVGLAVPVVVDRGRSLAAACGVYATPQAVLIDNGTLYFRGNYNKSRYCTDANSNFASMALDSLLSGKPSPVFSELATKAYGCGLQKDSGFQLF